MRKQRKSPLNLLSDHVQKGFYLVEDKEGNTKPFEFTDFQKVLLKEIKMSNTILHRWPTSHTYVSETDEQVRLRKLKGQNQ